MPRALPSKMVVFKPRPGTYPRKESLRDVRLVPASKLNRYLHHGHFGDTTRRIAF